ncbi:MAG: hypothetical protein HY855_25890 [Burkholderiales bacterium]|nr:hypothetical protein [Burkholderiales bacterium]
MTPRLFALARLCAATLCLPGALLLVSPAQAAKPCPPTCVSAQSVVHAAGVPPGLRQAAEALGFDGDTLSAAAQDALSRLAGEAKALPAKAVLTLRVSADQGLAPAAARAQAAARVKALRTALAEAGVPAARVTIRAR